MFYLEAQNKVEQSHLKEEIQEGEVVIGAQGSSALSKKQQQLEKRRKKR